MKYKIYSIDDSRKSYTDKLYATLTGWNPIGSRTVNGAHSPSLQDAIDDFGIEIKTSLRVGQLGIWYSFLYALQEAPLVTFDDDAILSAGFISRWSLVKAMMPEDTDFFSLFLPRDSDHMWNKSMMVSRTISRVYSKYGGVSFYFTERGKEKIMSLLKEEGITGQYDDTLYRWAKEGKLNGYCLPPTQPDLVYITGQEKSIVQESEWYD